MFLVYANLQMCKTEIAAPLFKIKKKEYFHCIQTKYYNNMRISIKYAYVMCTHTSTAIKALQYYRIEQTIEANQ